MAKKTGKKPYKFRQARKDAKAGAKGVFKGKRKAFVKDITTKQTLEEREALKELSDARRRQRAGKADFIIDDRGNRVEVKPTETPQERIARDRAEARRRAYEMYPEDETELDKRKASKARMEAKNKAAIAKQEADRAARRGRNAPPLQQTPANERPLSRPVKKAAVKKSGLSKPLSAYSFMRDTAPEEYTAEQRKLSNEFIEDMNKRLKASAAEKKAAGQGKAAAAKNKPQVKKAVAKAKANKFANAKPIGTMTIKNGKMTFKPAEGFNFNELGKRRLDQMKKAGISEADAKKVLGTNKPAYEKKMTRAERSAANKAAWKNMSPAERKNWAANRPGAKAPVQSVTNVQPEKAGKGTKKPKFVQKKAPTMSKAEMKEQSRKALDKIAKSSAAKPETGKALAVRPKGTVATVKAVGSQGAKKAGVGAALKGAGRVAGKLIGGRVGLGIAAASVLGKPILKALTQEPAGAKKAKIAASKTPGPEARSNQPRITGRGRFVNKGVGATGSTYTVQKGDTLSSIAKANKTTLAAIREANPAIMKKKKYKQGNVIWSGTKVKLAKK